MKVLVDFPTYLLKYIDWHAKKFSKSRTETIRNIIYVDMVMEGYPHDEKKRKI